MTQKTLIEIKEQDQDFEWYPTTKDMLATVYNDMWLHSVYFTLLDIGAGDGRVFDIIDGFSDNKNGAIETRYAIEKSKVLIDAMPKDVCIVGTDFMHQSLIDKKVDCIFCNPPYSEFSDWMIKIIKEANAPHIYMIVPQRWKDNRQIQEALKSRKAKTNILNSTNFIKADRSARAKVDILHIDLHELGGYYGRETKLEVDPFDAWFDEYFKIKIGKDYTEDITGTEEPEESEKDSSGHKPVKGKNTIEVLAECYRSDLEHLLRNYQALGGISPELLDELGVQIKGIKEALKQKIMGLKCKYWEELFSNFDTLKKRLITSTRKDMTNKLNSHVNVDFTESNVYAVVVWALKNSNDYMDKQLLEVYKRMTSKENVSMYKSNRHMTADSWRYIGELRWENRDKPLVTHYALEYRVVLNGYYAIESERGYSWDYNHGGLHTDAHNYLADIFTVASNLGFDVDNDTMYRKWKSGKTQEFYYFDKVTDCTKTFCEVRAFKNGNLHIKFNKEFMKAFNIEAGRLNGWIKSPKEAASEMEVSVKTAECHFKTNLQLTTATVPMLQIVN